MLHLHQLKPLGLEPVDLDLAGGTCLCVTGPSGSGKTVWLRAIADLDVNSGSAKTSNITRSDVSAPAWRKAVAFVPAESGWWADRVGAHFAEGDPKPLLESLDLSTDCLDWEVARLSTGERQRLALVRALLVQPEVLLLDEPTSGLDEAATAAVETVLHHRLGGGTTMIMVTHDAAQVDRMGGVRAVVDSGHVQLPDSVRPQ